MHIIRYRRPDGTTAVGTSDGGAVTALPVPDIAALLRLSAAELRALIERGGPADEAAELLAPVDGRTEVWASGVTYERSKEARVEESAQKSVYELVYAAERPELFFKSVAWRVVTDGQPVGIREDSALNVPEPELALVVNAGGELVGYVVCNDMSSRSIEGENPLYLPQAKVYAGACALSSGIRPAWELGDGPLAIALRVVRGGETVFEGDTTTARLRRGADELIGYLFLGELFPDGAILSTGTGIVPGMDFTLEEGDEIDISIEGVGTLRNTVARGAAAFAPLEVAHA